MRIKSEHGGACPITNQTLAFTPDGLVRVSRSSSSTLTRRTVGTVLSSIWNWLATPFRQPTPSARPAEVDISYTLYQRRCDKGLTSSDLASIFGRAEGTSLPREVISLLGDTTWRGTWTWHRAQNGSRRLLLDLRSDASPPDIYQQAYQAMQNNLQPLKSSDALNGGSPYSPSQYKVLEETTRLTQLRADFLTTV